MNNEQKPVHPVELTAQIVYSIQRQLMQIGGLVEALTAQLEKSEIESNKGILKELNAQK
jgi:hypothetical protein